MEKSSILEKALVDVQFYDLSIQSLSSGKNVLILICKQEEESNKLVDILNQYAFDLKISMNEQSGNYSLDFYFIDSDIGFQFDTGKSETTYPPLQKLKNNQISFISTGIWTGMTQGGRSCKFNSQLKRLGLIDIGDSFQQATGIQFITGNSDKEPSAVVLTYKSYNHIFEAEADKAYNRLADMAKSKPLLEIAPVSSKTINLRIWDILVDLDVKFEELNYSETQLNDFLKKTGGNHSFAFAIGFSPMGNEKVALASTKKEGFELITLYGYTFIK